MDFDSNPIPPYVKLGASIGVFKAEDLLPAIMDILENKNKRNELAINKKKFLDEFGYKNDGKATQRVIDLIREMIKNNKEVNNEH